MRETVRVTRLVAENIKRIHAIDITPPEGENVIVIGGENAAGKSSTIDCISYALGGMALCPKKPIRDGEDHASIGVTISKKVNKTWKPWLIVTRTFTLTNSYLKVTNSEGWEPNSPQDVLDELVGILTFDPLAFVNQKPPKQLETLKMLTGVDTSKLEEQRAAKYAERTTVNKEAVALKAVFEEMTFHDDAPVLMVSVSDLMDELSSRQNVNATNEGKRSEQKNLALTVDSILRDVDTLESNVAKAEKLLADKQRALDAATKKRNAGALAIDDLVDQDEDEIRVKISGAQGLNAKISENADYENQIEFLSAATEKSAALTAEIKALVQKKTDAVKKAKFPVAGLGFGDAGVTFNEIPFEQCSQAEMWRVSVGMGLALATTDDCPDENRPMLPIMLIHDGSLLDDKNMELMYALAKEYDAHIWIERVGNGPEVSILIDGGYVVGEKEMLALRAEELSPAEEEKEAEAS